GALAERVAEAAFDRGDVFLGNASAGDGVFEHELFRFLLGQRFQMADDVRELPRTARLLLVTEGERGRLGRRLAVTHLRRADFHLDAVLTADAFDVNLQVQFAHAGDDRFGGFLVRVHTESRVFLAEPL